MIVYTTVLSHVQLSRPPSSMQVLEDADMHSAQWSRLPSFQRSLLPSFQRSMTGQPWPRGGVVTLRCDRSHKCMDVGARAYAWVCSCASWLHTAVKPSAGVCAYLQVLHLKLRRSNTCSFHTWKGSHLATSSGSCRLLTTLWCEEKGRAAGTTAAAPQAQQHPSRQREPLSGCPERSRLARLLTAQLSFSGLL